MRRTAVALVVAALAVDGLGAQSRPTLDQLLDRMGTYLAGYEPALSSVVADEQMTQRARERQWVVNHRRIESEVAFIALPGGTGWMGFRRVVKVNGNAVTTGAPLAELMNTGAGDDYALARKLLADSAAHNLGAPRTINLPNLPLEMLHPRHRHRFAAELFGSERVRGIATTVVRLEEIAKPTIITQPDGSDMKSAVWAWLEPASGRLLRARVVTRDARIGMPVFDAVVHVEFRDDPKVGMLVPFEMTETFFAGRGLPGGTGTAKYTNYRRFSTGARVVPQQ